MNRIQTAEAKRSAIAEQLEDCDSQINQYDARKEQLDAILRDNQTTTTLQKKKEELERRIATERKALADATAAYFREFSAESLPFFAQPLLSTASAFLKEVKVHEYSNDYMEYNESLQTRSANITADLDLMLLEMEDEDDNPFGEELGHEEDLDDDEFLDESADNTEIDEYEFDNVDPEIFLDPSLMVKWINRHSQD